MCVLAGNRVKNVASRDLRGIISAIAGTRTHFCSFVCSFALLWDGAAKYGVYQHHTQLVSYTYCFAWCYSIRRPAIDRASSESEVFHFTFNKHVCNTVLTIYICSSCVHNYSRITIASRLERMRFDLSHYPLSWRSPICHIWVPFFIEIEPASPHVHANRRFYY